MSTVQEIEGAISRLSPGEMAELRAWLAEHEAEMWDRQLESDAANGRLDALRQRLMEDEGEEDEMPLDEVLNDQRLS